MRRSMGLAAAVVALSLVFPLGASAAPPWSRIEPGVVADFPAGWVCPESTGEVIVTYLGGSGGDVVKRDGRLMAMGGGQYEVTAVATGASVVVRTAAMTSLSPDGNIGHGAGLILWVFFPGDPGPGDTSVGRTLYMAGHEIMQVSPPAFTYSGRVVLDVCAAIS